MSQRDSLLVGTDTRRGGTFVWSLFPVPISEYFERVGAGARYRGSLWQGH